METVRQKILNLLKIRQTTSSGELAQLLKMTPANARRHLAILVDQGAVKVIGFRRDKGRGRPERIFGLARAVEQHNLELLAGALLEEYLSSMPGEPEAGLRQIARRMAGKAFGELKTPTKRLYATSQILSQWHYQARWEAHADFPRIILAHCPYAAILPAHPELCRLDALLLEEMLATTVAQTARLEPNPHGIPQCIFAVGKKV